jgi:uncharacterized protein YaiL (DUF2058 family)
MDFSQFLQNSYSKKNKSESSEKNVKPKNSKLKENISSNSESLLNTNNLKDSNLNIYKNLRKGNMVKIIRLQNSELNYYKGYIGEVRDYKKDQTHALIFLHAKNNNITISFPLTHLELI